MLGSIEALDFGFVHVHIHSKASPHCVINVYDLLDEGGVSGAVKEMVDERMIGAPEISGRAGERRIEKKNVRAQNEE